MPDLTERRIAVAPPTVPSAGLGFALFGLPFIAVGLVLLRSVLNYVRALPPDSPNRNAPLVSIVKLLFALFIPILLVLPFDYWAFVARGPAALVVLVVLVNLVFLAFLAYVALRIARKIRYGAAFIRYDCFPFFLGDRLDVRVGTGKPPAPGPQVTVTLRFVVEKLGEVGTHPNNTYHQLYADEQRIDPAFASPREGITVSFPLPEGDYATAISALYRRFWQLHLHASARGADYDETFLLPIYARRAVSTPAVDR